jgi:anaerobic ribonucleoside-triphosphate reductase activating protein
MIQTSQDGGLPLLNIAHYTKATRALGPGLRAVVWVQGCPFNCKDCVAQGWIEDRINLLVSPKDLAEVLLEEREVSGFTFSGGEPMLKAAGLADLIIRARRERELSLVVYTGFKLDYLYEHMGMPGVGLLLAETDVLIDGTYNRELNDNRGLRGSSNQNVHYLTNRLVGYDFIHNPRKVEINLNDGSAFVVGVPPKDLPARIKEFFTPR